MLIAQVGQSVIICSAMIINGLANQLPLDIHELMKQINKRKIMSDKIKNPRTGKYWERSLVEYDEANNPRFPDDYHTLGEIRTKQWGIENK